MARTKMPKDVAEALAYLRNPGGGTVVSHGWAKAGCDHAWEVQDDGVERCTRCRGEMRPVKKPEVG